MDHFAMAVNQILDLCLESRPQRSAMYTGININIIDDPARA